jgi:hypothetical protein
MEERDAEHRIFARVFEECLERAPRPEPNWETERAAAGA